jgi:acyl dehydratase
VYVGDTITCTVTVLEKDEPRRRVECGVDFVNGEGAQVLRARFAGFPGQVRLAR